MNTATNPALWNLDALDEGIARIEADPQSWQQWDWRCATGCCLAGHIALAAGATWATEDPDSPLFDHVIPAGGNVSVPVHGHALDVLGMRLSSLTALLRGELLEDEGDRRSLFYGGNTLADIKAMARDLHAAQDAAKAAQS